MSSFFTLVIFYLKQNMENKLKRKLELPNQVNNILCKKCNSKLIAKPSHY